EGFSDALQRVLLVCKQKDQNPVTNISSEDETLTMTSEAGEIGKGQEQLAAEVNGTEIKIKLNPQYVIDVLKVMGGEQVTLNWIDEFNPRMVSSACDSGFV